MFKLITFLCTLTPTYATPYHYLSYDTIQSRLTQLASDHPDLVTFSTAHELYKLPQVGQCGGKKQPCDIFILQITNKTTFTPDTPEVYFSGEIHGDERVGPTTLVELAQLLVSSTNPWIRMLVNTRVIIMTPMTNALGYEQFTRTEGDVDTNRDYPIDQPPNNCMRAITSRAVNEIFRSHLIQLAVTFHGGMEAIALEWGTKPHEAIADHKSPDDVAQMSTGALLAAYAGSFPGTKQYPVGRMNDLVYPVLGGMEDWAYSGSWDPISKRNPCEPSTYGGYAREKTIYDDAMLRVVNILVETSDAKNPPENTLGGVTGVLQGTRGKNGHVSRNMRLALAVIDMVQPWVRWVSVPSAPLLVPVNDVNGRTLGFDVGGALSIDMAWIEIRLVASSSSSVIIHRIPIVSSSQPTHWGSRNDGFVGFMDRLSTPTSTPGFSPLFSKCVSFIPTNAHVGDRYAVKVMMQVDSNWGMPLQESTPKGYKPQSHWVNARTNEAWSKHVGNHRVTGVLTWESDEMTIVVVAPTSTSRQSENTLPPKCIGFESWTIMTRNDTVPVDLPTTTTVPDQPLPNTDDGPANITIPVALLASVLLILYCLNKRQNGGRIVYDRLPTVAHHRTVDDVEGSAV